jgi:hypothetical protein
VVRLGVFRLYEEKEVVFHRKDARVVLNAQDVGY